jgi:hypothetical protein
MNKKQFFARLTAALAIAATLNLAAFTNRSEALVGLLTANPGVAVAGGVLAGAGLLMPAAGYGADKATTKPSSPLPSGMVGIYLGAIAGIALVAIGAVILDTNAPSAPLKFIPMRAEQAANIGLTNDEFRAYNQETDEITAVAETIQFQMMQAHDPSPELARKLWQKNGADLSPEALSAVAKIGAGAAQAAQQAHSSSS